MSQKIKCSNGMLTDVASCSTLAMSHTAGYTTPGGDDRKMVAGHSAHIALEHWLQGSDTDAAISAFLADYENYSNQYVEAKNAYHHDNLVRILDYSLRAHALDQMPFEVITTEREIEATLVDEPDCPVILVDRADGLVCNKENGSLWAMEHKTTGAAVTDHTWVMQWRMHPQIMAHIYCWRAEGYDVKGVLMNAIQFNRIPAPTDTKCRTHKIETRLCWASHIHQNLFEVQPSEDAYQAWILEQTANAKKYKRLLLGRGSVPQEGLTNGHCGHCHLQEFCYKGRNAYELLVTRDAPSWITRSGLYKED